MSTEIPAPVTPERIYGTGDRLRDPTESGPAQPGFRWEPNSRSFSPEQICLAVGRFERAISF